ncbi:G patch domain-containing protein 3-like [Tubulanus polymorphus]|uniref:G patch domain-containing protein 3-like n=1 Tax=Tubulanus polymorphus TaxID=672921 RepID=UPI003DA4B995
MEMNEFVYAVVRNIPKTYHTSDLRNYFSQFIESGGFDCFHFKHRPEKTSTYSSENIPSSTTTSSSSVDAANTGACNNYQMYNDDSARQRKKTSGSDSLMKTYCCIVRMSPENLKRLLKMYNRKHWLDINGDSIASLCQISKIKVKDIVSDSKTKDYKTRIEEKQIPTDREEFTKSDLKTMRELHPPPLMKNGNVGTPTMVFMDLIKQCKLPSKIIKSLGLKFPRLRLNKRYGKVPFDYGGTVVAGTLPDDVVLSGEGTEIISTDTCTPMVTEDENRKAEENISSSCATGEDSDPDNDDDTCEEWERHEALYDDPDNQERNKERLFEEEIELKWEKGGSGLVFYTDAQYWQEKEGDFDEQTADDWDIDMSVYYEKNAGDKDARDIMMMRREQNRHQGIFDKDDNTFRPWKRIKQKYSCDSNDEDEISTKRIGSFEKFTKGFGRKLMEKQGWKDGQGLGSSFPGMAEALENDGQNPKCRHGFGYYGEKLTDFKSMKKPRTDRQFIVSTVYDKHEDTDPPETVSRRNNHYGLKYRTSRIDFVNSS